MRNLKLKYCKQLSIKQGHQFKTFLLDPNEAHKETDAPLYAVTDSDLYEIKTTTGSTKLITTVPDIVAAEYLVLNNEICVATGGGEVLSINPSTGAHEECTFCDVGLQCMTWSPDQEVAVFITKPGNVVVMTCTYDVISEHVLNEQCDPDSQFMNVGWGKKETQFHGTEGKVAAKRTSEYKPPENTDQLPQGIEITWRADSAFFAVSFVSSQVGRMFKVFNKEGYLAYISERWNDLQPSIAWRPSGTWIAIPQLFPNKSTISLFEKNGLRHREIVLPFSLLDEPVRSLKWSNDSDILTIETVHETTKKQHLYLYTIGNYHWYLKQVISFEQTNPVINHAWDQRIGEEKTLHVWLANGAYLIYRWRLDFDRYERSGIVAVIDGKKLLLTDFTKAIVPPPMCSREIASQAYINACAIGKGIHDDLQLCVYDVDDRLQLFCTDVDGSSLTFRKVSVLKRQENKSAANNAAPPLELASMFWFDESRLIATANKGEKSTVCLIALDLATESYKVVNVLELQCSASSSCMGFPRMRQCFVQTLNGEIRQISIQNDNTLKSEKIYECLEQKALRMEWHQTDISKSGYLISLLLNQRLYINGDLISGDVTSFCLTDNYLVYTKLTELNFVLLATGKIVNTRNMERGGRLVTTIENDARIVLQMPRGNLEAITPRVLALEIIGDLLDRLCYYEAFDLLRKQRINLNIVCDHNMVRFVNNVHIFLRKITNPNWLNLFLTDLQNEDFSKTMYASNYTEGKQIYPEDFKIESKVTYLSALLCTHMAYSGDENFRLPIITAYVKIGKLEQALQLIWQAKKEESNTNTNEPTNESTAEDALKYLLYLVDVNELYNVALGTYDFGLVLFVAQKSQKDPKEFLAFLNELKKMNQSYRKFKIDEYLKRYEKALGNIVKCGTEKFDEALEFIKRHELYKQALRLYKHEAPSTDKNEPEEEGGKTWNACLEEICLAFADHLRAKGELESASIMYERGGNFTQALLSAKNVLDWRRVLMLAQLDGQDMAAVALSMVPALQEQGLYDIAHQLHKTYGTNFKDALQCLLKGHLYLQAIFEARLNGQDSDLLEKLVKPALIAYSKQLQNQLSDDENLFVEHKQRLNEVRVLAQQKRDGLVNFYENDIDEADLLSDTTSMRSSRYTGSSQGTGKTFRSSKNRRKHERKLLSLKPGNPFEDIALIDALYNQVIKLFNQQQQMRDTCKALIELHLDEMAAKLQTQYGQLLKLLQDSYDAIWIEEMVNAQALAQYKPIPNTDYTQLQNEQRYAVLAPQKRFKPQVNLIDWKCEILA